MLCLLWVLGASPLVGQGGALSAEELFQRAAKQGEKQPVELRHAGREMRRAANAGCPEVQAGWALELFAEGLGQGQADLDACFADVARCSSTYTRLHWYAGFLLYREGRFTEALDQMELALRDDLVRAKALDARGGLHALLGNYDAAIADFTALLDLDTDAAPLSVFVNLAGIHVVMGQWDEAVRWTSKGLEQVEKMRDAVGASGAEFSQVTEVEQALLSNQLAAATRKGDEELAISTWRMIELVDLEQANVSNLNSILDFALTDDRFQIYEFIREEGRRRWADLPYSEWQGLGASNLLLNPQWDRHFFADSLSVSPSDSLRRRWNVVRALYFQTGGPNWQESSNGVGAWLGLDEVGWLLFLVSSSVLLFAMRWWWRQWRLHEELGRPRHSIEDFIQGFKALGQGKPSGALLEELNGFLSKRRSGINWSELNAGETELLLAIIAGKGSKEIAQMTNRSPASIYNMRSSIRRKLNIPEGVELEGWCAEMNEFES